MDSIPDGERAAVEEAEVKSESVDRLHVPDAQFPVHAPMGHARVRRLTMIWRQEKKEQNEEAECKCTMVENSREYRLKYWVIRSSVRSFARTAYSFACSGLLASLAPSAALTRSLACSLRSLPRSWESEFLMSQNDLVLSHSAAPLTSLSLTARL